MLYLFHGDKSGTMTEWAEYLGIPRVSLYKYYRSVGRDFDATLEHLVRDYKRKPKSNMYREQYNNGELTVSGIAKKYGVSRQAVHRYMRRNGLTLTQTAEHYERKALS